MSLGVQLIESPIQTSSVVTLRRAEIISRDEPLQSTQGPLRHRLARVRQHLSGLRRTILCETVTVVTLDKVVCGTSKSSSGS
jgi:hypothetical protein